MKEIPLTKGKFAIVDDDMYEELSKYKWQENHGYACRNTNRKTKKLFMHNVIADTPSGMFCDHIDGNKLNNLRSNLRNCTKQQNGFNRKKNTNSKNKYRCVYSAQYKTSSGEIKTYWYARIRVFNKSYYKYCRDEISAVMAYNDLAKQHHGEFARLNEVA